MRKIKSHVFISLDGVVESPDKWRFPYSDDEMGDAVGAGFATTCAGCCARACSTSSTCSCTRSRSVRASRGSFSRTSRAFPSSSCAQRPSRPAC